MRNKVNLQLSIINTLCYSDIFDYPLSLPEISQFLISKSFFSQAAIKEALNSLLGSLLEQKEEFYFLKGRKNIVEKRQERQIFSKSKFIKAEKVVKLLSFIPTIEMIALSGSLALNNSDKQDDIDLFIITKANFLWISRFFLNAFLAIKGLKRKRLGEQHKDKFCLNMFMSENDLSFQGQNRNLFIAKEIAQLKVILAKNGIYEKLLNKNQWINKFMNNFFTYNYKNIVIKTSKIDKKKHFFTLFLTGVALFLERIAFIAQYIYMKKHITRERISLAAAFFHPFDYKEIILSSFNKKKELYQKKYKKIFKISPGKIS